LPSFDFFLANGFGSLDVTNVDDGISVQQYRSLRTNAYFIIISKAHVTMTIRDWYVVKILPMYL
jgi:hypothetical protein